ncbi:hypothetical protein AK812_SmicGene13510 [Symbiodinium microadriaticum]|uniref:Uncharacterized protein n=1 Tax=Symbiodinium microadriaticum TaxID=2951 RepID=A0A1Q9E7Z2_SYMMI|nr:hypothetical protein AK812_SmicGene13510 [Symbiodinium microadriaticum]CAE7274604.1 unnamed protein product [Symbiodinium sp. KB8]CAE7893588.1 unnamed protein product [Symbiodinium microadriaticum]
MAARRPRAKNMCLDNLKRDDRKEKPEKHGPSKAEAQEKRLELLAEMTDKLQLILQRLSDPNLLDAAKKETYRNMAESIQRQIASLKPPESKKQQRREERRRRQEKRYRGSEFRKPETTTSQEDPKDDTEKPWVSEALMDSESSEPSPVSDSEPPPTRARPAPSCAPHLQRIAPSSAPAVRKPLPRPATLEVPEATDFQDSGPQPADKVDCSGPTEGAECGFVADSVASC